MYEDLVHLSCTFTNAYKKHGSHSCLFMFSDLDPRLQRPGAVSRCVGEAASQSCSGDLLVSFLDQA